MYIYIYASCVSVKRHHITNKNIFAFLWYVFTTPKQYLYDRREVTIVLASSCAFSTHDIRFDQRQPTEPALFRCCFSVAFEKRVSRSYALRLLVVLLCVGFLFLGAPRVCFSISSHLDFRDFGVVSPFSIWFRLTLIQHTPEVLFCLVLFFFLLDFNSADYFESDFVVRANIFVQFFFRRFLNKINRGFFKKFILSIDKK